MVHYLTRLHPIYEPIRKIPLIEQYVYSISAYKAYHISMLRCLCLKRPVSTAWHRVLSRRQWLCTSTESQYLEIEQLKDIKTDEFYDLQAQQRRYFYYIDLQGRLFLEDTRPKNIATSLKSATFLRFFFSQLRPNGITQCTSKEEATTFMEYPFRSPCGREMNFIKCADRPFVFEEFRRDDSGKWTLVFGGGELVMPFRPETLRVSLSTGRLYHDVQTKYVAPGTLDGIALVRSQLAVELGNYITLDDLPDDMIAQWNGRDAVVGAFEWENQRYGIHAIE